MIFICSDIPSRLLTNYVFPDDIESWTLEMLNGYFLKHITLHLKKDPYYFNNLDKFLALYSHCDKKLLLVWYFTQR